MTEVEENCNMNFLQLDVELYIEEIKAGIKQYVQHSHRIYHPTEADDKPFDMRLPLIACVYVLIPAITIIIVRNWFADSSTFRKRRLHLQLRCIGCYVFSCGCTLAYMCSIYTYKELMLSKMYILVAFFMSLFLILLSYGWRKKPDVRKGVIIAYLGIALSFVTIAIAAFYPDESELMLALYDIGIVIFFVGIVLVHMLAMS